MVGHRTLKDYHIIMSYPTIARFPDSPLPHRKEGNPDAAKHARERIAALPDPYLAHATPSKEKLVGVVDPVSPAAEHKYVATGTPDTLPRQSASQADSLPANLQSPAATVAAEAAPVPMPTTAAAANPLEQTEASSHEMPPAPTAAKPVPPRSLPSRLRPLIVGVLTFAGLLLVFKAPIFLSQLNYLTQPKTNAVTASQAAAEVPPNPTISIPKINVNAPVVYATDNSENAILTDLESGVVHYANTALPGQIGNSVIFGHSSNNWWDAGNYKFVFVLLDKLQPGDTFTVNYQSHQYMYQVTGSTVVEPTDLSVLDQTNFPEMTLITCTPPGTSWKRLVVTAKQISPAPATAAKPAAGSTANSSGSTLPSNSPSLTQQISSWWDSVVRLFTGKSSATPPASGSTPAPSNPGTSGSTLPAT